MGSSTFPSLRIQMEEFTREPVFDTTVQRARDGSEFRVDWGASGYRWEFTIRTVGTERSTLENFFLGRHGRWDSFYFTDPTDNVSRLVRFDSDSLPGRKIAPTVWEYRIALVSVP